MVRKKRKDDRSEAPLSPGDPGPGPSGGDAIGGGSADGLAGAGGGGGALARVEEEMAGLRDELSQVNARWLRALADLDNYRKRIERDRSRWAEAAREEILLDLLEVVDNFERAVACGEDAGPPSDDPYRQGVELILEHLKALLAKNGVQPIDTCGAEFDPVLHEAVGHVESAEHESNQIVEETRRGYTMGDRLLRCPRVIVAK